MFFGLVVWEWLELIKNIFYRISETTSMLSSFKFKKIILLGNYEGVLDIIR